MNWKAIVKWIKKLLQIYKKGGGKMKFVALVLGIMLISSVVMAEGVTLNLQQGGVLTWRGELKNMTGVKAYELVDDKPISNWPNWAKALLVGDCATAIWAYDGNNLKAGGVLIGKNLGAISQYIPAIKWNLLNQVDVHAYPIGILIERDNNQTRVTGVSGLALKW